MKCDENGGTLFAAIVQKHHMLLNLGCGTAEIE
jgi:hypothetical protein